MNRPKNGQCKSSFEPIVFIDVHCTSRPLLHQPGYFDQDVSEFFINGCKKLILIWWLTVGLWPKFKISDQSVAKNY